MAGRGGCREMSPTPHRLKEGSWEPAGGPGQDRGSELGSRVRGAELLRQKQAPQGLHGPARLQCSLEPPANEKLQAFEGSLPAIARPCVSRSPSSAPCHLPSAALCLLPPPASSRCLQEAGPESRIVTPPPVCHIVTGFPHPPGCIVRGLEEEQGRRMKYRNAGKGEAARNTSPTDMQRLMEK